MEFEVIWTPPATNQLTDIWLAATDRNAVTLAQTAVDKLLAGDPFGCSRHLSEGLSTLRVPPLRVYFTVDRQLRKVSVEEVQLGF